MEISQKSNRHEKYVENGLKWTYRYFFADHHIKALNILVNGFLTKSFLNECIKPLILTNYGHLDPEIENTISNRYNYSCYSRKGYLVLAKGRDTESFYKRSFHKELVYL